MSGRGKSAPHPRQITTPVSQHSVFYRPDALPAAQPTESKHWRCIMPIILLTAFTFLQFWMIKPLHHLFTFIHFYFPFWYNTFDRYGMHCICYVISRCFNFCLTFLRLVWAKPCIYTYYIGTWSRVEARCFIVERYGGEVWRPPKPLPNIGSGTLPP